VTETVINPAIYRQNLIFNCRRPRDGEPGLDLKQRMVLLVLSDLIGSKKEYCFPSQIEVAERAGLSRGAVNRTLRSLVTLGVVRVEPRPGSSQVLNYSIQPAALVPLQRLTRARGIAGPPNLCSGVTSRQTATRAPDAQPGAGEEQPGAPDAQPCPSQTPGTVPEPSINRQRPLPVRRAADAARRGRGPAGERGRCTDSLTPSEASFLELLPDRYRSHVSDVENEVSLEKSKLEPGQLAFTLTEFLDHHPGVTALDLVQILQSTSFSGLQSRSWGLLLSNEKLLRRFHSLLTEAIDSRSKLQKAGQVPDSAILSGLDSTHLPTRRGALQQIAHRFTRTRDPKWLLHLALAAAGKSKDSAPSLRQQALLRLAELVVRELHLEGSPLPENVRVGLLNAVRRAKADEDEAVSAAAVIAEEAFRG
jgi:DNA-binding MarR family transcriptional regulator